MRGRETRSASRWTSAEWKSNEVQIGSDERETITNSFVFSFYNCLQAQIRDQGIRQDKRTWVICVRLCVCERACVTVHVSAYVCERPPADQSLAFTSDKSVAHHASLFHTQSSLNKADDDNNSWSAKLWMKHPVGPATCVCVPVCVCTRVMPLLQSEYVIHAGSLTMITLQSRAHPLPLATPMAVK